MNLPDFLRELAALLLKYADTVEPVDPAPAEDRLLTGSQLDKALQISASTRARLVKEGALPFVWVGKRKRYDLAACRAAVTARGERTVPHQSDGPVVTQAMVEAIARRAGWKKIKP